MNNVLLFKQRERGPELGPLAWECNCGSVTFFYLSDGTLECPECETIHVDHLTAGQSPAS